MCILSTKSLSFLSQVVLCLVFITDHFHVLCFNSSLFLPHCLCFQFFSFSSARFYLSRPFFCPPHNLAPTASPGSLFLFKTDSCDHALLYHPSLLCTNLTSNKSTVTFPCLSRIFPLTESLLPCLLPHSLFAQEIPFLGKC